MYVYPQDLGPNLEAALERERAEWRRATQPSPAPNQIGAYFLASSGGALACWTFGLTAFALLLGTAAIVLLGWYCKQALESVEWDPSGGGRGLGPQPVTLSEIQSRQRPEQEELLRSYLSLAASVVRAEAADPEAEREVRTALRALGETVEALPADDLQGVPDDPVSLSRESKTLSDQAQAEPDALIGASLRRRAASFAQRADTAARTSLLLRRHEALRQETREQIAALGTSLTAFRVGGRGMAPELADLAASIQRVSREANAIMEARAEVETLVAGPYQTGLQERDDRTRQRIGG